MSKTQLARGEPYPLGDRLTLAECERLGIGTTPVAQAGIMAVWTGEKRAPKKGEWYLSGAIIAAYRAPNDLLTEYHIARLVKVRRETRLIVEPLEGE